MEQLTLENLPKAFSQLALEISEIKHLLLNKSNDTLTNQSDQLLTVHQAAVYLSLAVPTVYSMVSRGELPVMKRSKRFYFSRQELMGYLKEGRKKTTLEAQIEAQDLLERKRG